MNCNPKGIKASDCVVRAICYATQQSWEQVYKDLCDLGFKMKRMPNEKKVYEKYLEQLGWKKMKQPRKANGFKYTVNDFIRIMPSDVCVISVANHLTVVIYDDIVDTWDCGYKTVGNYWIKEEK